MSTSIHIIFKEDFKEVNKEISSLVLSLRDKQENILAKSGITAPNKAQAINIIEAIINEIELLEIDNLPDEHGKSNV